MNKNLLILILLIFCFEASFGQLITNKVLKAKVDSMFIVQKELAKHRSGDLFGIFNSKMTAEEFEAMKFLFAFMPLSDMADYSGDFYFSQVKSALKTKTDFSWGKNIPEEVFLHFVLPVRVNNENLDSFRICVYDELKARVKGLSMKNAALEINHWCHEKVTYRGSDARTSSPLATMKTSFGRCGEESTFAVAAFRTVGIPARQVYTPRWAHSDDNHAWVEVWVDGKWHFLGACEPEADLDMGWFAEPAKRAMLVHTRAYGWYNGPEPVVMREDRFSELNLISNYAPSKKIIVKVINEKNKIIQNAKVDFLLYNYAEFFPIASIKTKQNGTTEIECGLGDLIVWASYDNLYSYKKISIGTVDTLCLILTSNHKSDYVWEEDFIPPVARTVNSADVKDKSENDRLLKKEDSLRTVYMKTFKDTAWAEKFAASLNLDKDSVVKIIYNSYGNWSEVSEFLKITNNEKKVWALRLLHTVADKDLRDVSAKVFCDHLEHSIEFKNKNNSDLFTENILNPRISFEQLSPWRSFLQNKLADLFAHNKDVRKIINWIKNNINIDTRANLHSRAPLSPIGVYNLRVSDIRSRNIFFVALCRSFGIPSRLNPQTIEPEYYENSKWIPVFFETEVPEKNIYSKGFVQLVNKSLGLKPKYYLNFTLGKFQRGVYKTLEFEENRLIDDFPEKLELDTGKYLLVTGNRLNNGSVLSRLTFFDVKKDEKTKVEVTIREQAEKPKPWGKINPAKYVFINHGENLEYKFDESIKLSGAILIYIDPDKEPTKHVMKDIPEFKDVFEKWGGPIFFIIDKEKVSTAFNKSQYKNLPKNSRFVYDSGMAFLSDIEMFKNKNLRKSFPVIIVTDDLGNLIYFSEGYRIGVGEQLAKEIGR